jgi:hypothetical protein
MKSATVRKPTIDALFLGQFRDHVGTCLTCACTFEGPDRNCDMGVALWNLATRKQAVSS